MIGTGQAIWLAFLFFAFTGIVGLMVGFAISKGARLRWTGLTAMADAAVSAITAAVLAYVIYTVEAAHGSWESHNGVIILLASAAVVLKHGIRFLFPNQKTS